jgi:hypothetical protein
MLGYGAVAVDCRAVVAQVREGCLVLVSRDDFPGILVAAEMRLEEYHCCITLRIDRRESEGGTQYVELQHVVVAVFPMKSSHSRNVEARVRGHLHEESLFRHGSYRDAVCSDLSQ